MLPAIVRGSFPVVFLMIVAVLAAPATAEACSCVGMTLTTVEQKRRDVRRHLETSDAVFLGQITAVNAEWVEFRVLKVWKGGLGPAVLLGTANERVQGGMIRWESCTRGFGSTAGASFIVFADGAPPGFLKAHSCGRSTSWEEAAELEAFLNDLAQTQTPHSVDPWWHDRRQIVSEVLDAIDLGSNPVVIAGPDLDPLSRAAAEQWRSSFAGRRTRGRPPILRSSRVVVEAVYGSPDEARVLLTAGSVPDIPRSVCGVSMMVPLTRAGSGWSVADARTSANCSNLGVAPIMLSARLQPVLEREALLLTLSHLQLGNDLQLVAGSSVSDLAAKVLEDLGAIMNASRVESEHFVLPATHFLVKGLEVKDGTALVEGTLGPVPRRASLACGTGYRVKLLAVEGGWRVAELVVTQC